MFPVPGVPFCHLLRGQILFRLRRLEEAATSVEQALRMQRESLHYLLPEREVAMLSEAGFAMRGCFMRA